MTYKKERILKSIADNLSYVCGDTKLLNTIGLFDYNRIAQGFYKGLFSLVFGYQNLQELDKSNGNGHNYPAIDLGDTTARIAFQITTDPSSTKINYTIEKFIKHELYLQYDRLVYFVIGQKKDYTANFDTKTKFNFNESTDIWDIYSLIRDIDRLELQKIIEIDNFLREQLEEYKYLNPEILLDEEIKTCIEILKKHFGSAELIEQSLRRGDGFIERKNELNKMSPDFFTKRITGHLKYNQAINDFLKEPINAVLQQDYLAVAQAIQNFYKNPVNKFQSIQEVFSKIFAKIDDYIYDDHNIADAKLRILVHNMYFNCDFGDNPNDGA